MKWVNTNVCIYDYHIEVWERICKASCRIAQWDLYCNTVVYVWGGHLSIITSPKQLLCAHKTATLFGPWVTNYTDNSYSNNYGMLLTIQFQASFPKVQVASSQKDLKEYWSYKHNSTIQYLELALNHSPQTEIHKCS